MAHFAKITENNEVLEVLTLNDNDMLNADGVEDESVGQQYLETHNNWPAHLWIQTSYNTLQGKHNSGDDSKAFRGNYAGLNYIWDADNNIFINPKPFPSWVLNLSEARWQSPIGDAPALTAEQQMENEENTDYTYHHIWCYVWNEETQVWDLSETRSHLTGS